MGGIPGSPPSNPKRWHHKKVARSIQSNATVQVLPGLAGDVPSPSLIMRTKGQQNVKANGGLILCPLSSNLPYRSRRVERRLQQRRKTVEAGFELSVPRDTTKVYRALGGRE